MDCLPARPAAPAAPARAASPPPWGTGESQGEDLVISLVTFSPGDDVASWWGHGSLVVEDRRLGAARLYNYGMFSFDSTMLGRYAMGRLEFWVAEASVRATYRAYKRVNRDVRIQELNLTPAQRVEVARLLADERAAGEPATTCTTTTTTTASPGCGT